MIGTEYQPDGQMRQGVTRTPQMIEISQKPFASGGACPHATQTGNRSSTTRGRPVRRSLGAGGSPITDHRFRSGFTLIELLVVIGIIGLLLVLMGPAFTSIKGGNDVTSAAYTIQGVLDTARTYAKANNTYTWVGFYEEDASQQSMSPASPGNGRVVVSTVASKDGTMLYTGNLSNSVVLDPTKIVQIGKLTKIDNLHLQTFNAGAGTGDTFAARPAVTSNASKIGDSGNITNAPPNPSLTFNYPVAGSQYTFQKVVQFSPRGEAVVTNSNYTMAPVSEIGVQPTHGIILDPNSTNPVAVQFTGFGGNTKIYRK